MGQLKSRRHREGTRFPIVLTYQAERNKMIPADMILLYSSDPKGIISKISDHRLCLRRDKKSGWWDQPQDQVCKQRPPDYFQKYRKCRFENFFSCQISGSNSFQFNYERPTPYLYNFKGSFKGINLAGSLDYTNFVLRGSSLKNTDFIYGLVCYTGYKNLF